MRLWDKGAPLDERVLRYTAGEDHLLDERLVRYDVRASIAHAEMLADRGLLSRADLAAISSGLGALADEHARGLWHIELADEDGQTALERRLTERIGPAGGRVHLGRSRNDQVLTALRLYLRDATAELAAAAVAVAVALEALAAREPTTALPGYTHMQQAMPSSVALWAGGFAAEIRDDAEGLAQVQRRTDKNPLGSAAGYGTPGLALDRAATTRTLGFAATQEPVTAVQLSRGKAEAQLLFELTLLLQDLGRLAADVLLFYTQEFGFVTLPEAFTTGSSIMPQKRNPDVFELVRARSATAQACPRRWPSPPSCPPATTAICNCSRRRCSARSTWPRRLSSCCRPESRRCDSTPSACGPIRTSMRRRRRTPSRCARASAFARLIGASPRSSKARGYVHVAAGHHAR